MQVFVFDLDFTIWNSGDTFCSETNPPYFWNEDRLVDQAGRWIRMYPESVEVLKMLKSKGVLIAAASRTNKPVWAIQLLQMFGIDQYFDIKEIYPGSKTSHLKRIQEQIGCSFDQMVFFDDEERNIKEVESFGVISILVKDGITLKMAEGFFLGASEEINKYKNQ